jgi:hypothetical protein
MQVRHGFDVKRVAAHAVNDGVGKALEVELAIVTPGFAPAFRFGHDAAQRAFKLVQESVAKARLLFLIPQRRGFQFLVGFRRADDAHGTCCGCPGQPAPPAGN